MTDALSGTRSPARAFGLYAVIAYSFVLAVPRDFSLPAQLPMGRFTLEGQAARVMFLAWLAAWVVMVIGLWVRRMWGYWWAWVVLGLHVFLVGSNSLRWLADNSAPVRIAFEVAVWPGLQLIFADILALAYLYERRSIFLPSSAGNVGVV